MRLRSRWRLEGRLSLALGSRGARLGVRIGRAGAGTAVRARLRLALRACERLTALLGRRRGVPARLALARDRHGGCVPGGRGCIRPAFWSMVER